MCITYPDNILYLKSDVFQFLMKYKKDKGYDLGDGV